MSFHVYRMLIAGVILTTAVAHGADRAKNTDPVPLGLGVPDSSGPGASAVLAGQRVLVSSLDVPKTIPDNDPTGITSTLTGPNLTITDLNLIFDNLQHTCDADLHVELRSPSGHTVVLIKAFTEDGILIGLDCPHNFIGTVLDDQAALNLRDGTAPYTGSFNIEHASVVPMPLSQFNGENAAGTWTLFVSDRAAGDTGSLEHWSLQFTGSPVSAPAPALNSFGLGVLGISLFGVGLFLLLRRRQGQISLWPSG